MFQNGGNTDLLTHAIMEPPNHIIEPLLRPELRSSSMTNPQAVVTFYLGANGPHVTKHVHVILVSQVRVILHVPVQQLSDAAPGNKFAIIPE
jgi:hypothetical protein